MVAAIFDEELSVTTPVPNPRTDYLNDFQSSASSKMSSYYRNRRMSAFGVSNYMVTMRRMRTILSYYKRRRLHIVRKVWGENRAKLLGHLRDLERKVGQEEKRVIREYFNSLLEDDISSLHSDLDRARSLAPPVAETDEQSNVTEPDETFGTLVRFVPTLIFSPSPSPALPLVECSVCLESQTPVSFPQRKITTSCSHEPTLCTDCLFRSLVAQISDLPWDQIKCPECPEPVPYDVVKQWTSADTFERYDKKSLISVFKDMPNFTMCLGPDCDSGQIHEGGDERPIMTCNICSYKTCFTHKMPWHSEQTCVQYEVERKEIMEQEAASTKLIAETAKVCPNSKCGYAITKNGGCDHMTCRQCAYQFCYLCFVAWKVIIAEGNHRHDPACKHYRAYSVSDLQSITIVTIDDVTPTR